MTATISTGTSTTTTTQGKKRQKRSFVIHLQWVISGSLNPKIQIKCILNEMQFGVKTCANTYKRQTTANYWRVELIFII